MTERIMVIGRPGSGKSTYTRKLHQRTGMPLHHLDRYFFLANWVERDEADFLSIQQKMVDGERWIIDGNCIASFEMRYQRATTCLYFNYPRSVCYYRILKRLLQKKSTADRAEGCKEVVRWPFIKYIWGFHKRVAPRVEALRTKYPAVKFVEISSDAALRQLASEIE